MPTSSEAPSAKDSESTEAPRTPAVPGASAPRAKDAGQPSVADVARWLDAHNNFGIGPILEPLAPTQSGFSFGSYGRMVAATNLHGQSGRDADIVAHGSRLDEQSYVELELRRQDYWAKTKTATRVVATLGVGTPLFHYTGDFDIKMAVRNLYVEALDIGRTGLSLWVGSRMYRGDDIHVLDYWPLDNLNTVGGGLDYRLDRDTRFSAHFGVTQPKTDFYYQEVTRPAVSNTPSTSKVAVLDRQHYIGSFKAAHTLRLGSEGAGLKAVAYGEVHGLPLGQRESRPQVYETLPADSGWVVGAELGGFTGVRDTHLNLFVRYAQGLAAYGDFGTPTQLAQDNTTKGAHELVVALGANYELGPLGVMAGGYLRSFRNGNSHLDWEDLDEGILLVRPYLFIGEYGGIGFEGSYQAQRRGALTASSASASTSSMTPPTANVYRFGVFPFLSPSGRGDYKRPQFRLIYAITARDQAARSLYPQDDVSSTRGIEHFLGLSAEWWFNMTGYGS